MPKEDRNFDDLLDKFEKKIYATEKGQWRLRLIKEDLNFLKQHAQVDIWDAGCGLGQIAHWLAESGHRVTLCDISKKMLDRAQQSFLESNLTAQFHHRSAQSLAATLPPFDIVLFHAVIEWLANPLEGLISVAKKVKSGGYLSLLFYNRNAMIYRNTLKGGWRLRYLLNDSYLGKGSKLTPPYPQYSHQLIDTLAEEGFQVVRHTGIRVFYDYLPEQVLGQSPIEDIFALEHRYCRQETFRDLGRYVHLVLKNEKTI